MEAEEEGRGGGEEEEEEIRFTGEVFRLLQLKLNLGYIYKLLYFPKLCHVIIIK